MTLKATKTWFLRLLPVVLFFICYYCSQIYYDSSGKSPQQTISLCNINGSQRKWNSLHLNLDCRTCVVIGNSFSVKNSSLGETINKYDVVIRLNDAPVRGFQEDVGNKTTLRLFYPESASYDPTIHNDPDTLLVLVPFKYQDLRWLKEILYNEKRVRKGFWKPPPQIWLGRFSQIRVLDPYFLRVTASELLKISLNPSQKQKPVHPTTGILAVFMALNYCDVVHVAGFGYPEDRKRQQPIHYYGQDTMKSMKNSFHDLNLEAQVLKRLEEQGVISHL